MKKIPLQTDAGIYHGEGTAFQIEIDQINCVLERVTRGLFYHHFNRRLPPDYSVSVCSTETTKRTSEDMDALCEMIQITKRKQSVFGNQVFMYNFAVCEDEPNATFWIFKFFSTKPFWVYVVPPEI